MSTTQSKSAAKHLRNAEILSILVKRARAEKQAAGFFQTVGGLAGKLAPGSALGQSAAFAERNALAMEHAAILRKMMGRRKSMRLGPGLVYKQTSPSNIDAYMRRPRGALRTRLSWENAPDSVRQKLLKGETNVVGWKIPKNMNLIQRQMPEHERRLKNWGMGITGGAGLALAGPSLYNSLFGKAKHKSHRRDEEEE